MAVNRQILRKYMKRQGITQDNLADLIGRDIRTIRRWLSPKHQLSHKETQQICQALAIDPEVLDPDWDPTNFSKQTVQVGARVSVAASNYYALLKREYGVTQKDLIELAPVMFSIIAKRAYGLSNQLSRQAESLETTTENMNLFPSNYRMREIAGAIESALKAEENGWLFGDENDNYNETHQYPWEATPNLFSTELNELSKDLDNGIQFGGTASIPTCQGTVLPVELIDEISCGNPDLKKAITNGSINLTNVAEHLWLPENGSERVEWMKSELNTYKKLRKIEDEAWRKKNPVSVAKRDETNLLLDNLSKRMQEDG